MKKEIIYFILSAIIVLMNFQLSVSAQQSTSPTVINQRDFTELQQVLKQIESKCNVTCPKVDINKANDLAEALMKTLYTVQVYNQVNEPAWLRDMETQAFKKHDSAQKRNNGIANPMLEQQWQACYKAVNLAGNTLKLVKKAQDKFYNTVNKYVSRKSYPFDPIPSFSSPKQGVNYLNAQLKKNLATLKLCVSNFPITSYTEKPEIKLTKKLFLAREEITISFKALPCFAEDAWIGIVPSNVEHSEAKSDQFKISNRHIGNKLSGEISFVMPDKPGRYDFRMFDTEEDGKEVFWTWFEVISHYVKTTKTTFTSTERIGIEYANFETNKPNWIVIAKAGDPAGLGTGLTITGKSKGLTSYKPLPEGEYEIRAFINGDRTKIADSKRFTVKKAIAQNNDNDPSFSRALAEKGKGLLIVHTEISGCGSRDTIADFRIYQNGEFVTASYSPTATDPTFELKPPPYQFELKPGAYDLTIQGNFLPIAAKVKIEAGKKTIFSRGENSGRLEIRLLDKTGNLKKFSNYKIVISDGAKELFSNYWWSPTERDAGFLPTGNYYVTVMFTATEPYHQEEQTRQVNITGCKTVTLHFHEDGKVTESSNNAEGIFPASDSDLKTNEQFLGDWLWVGTPANEITTFKPNGEFEFHDDLNMVPKTYGKWSSIGDSIFFETKWAIFKGKIINGNTIQAISQVPGERDKGNFTMTRTKQKVAYKAKWHVTFEYSVGSKQKGSFYALLKENGKWDMAWNDNGQVDFIDYGDWKLTGDLFVLNWKEPSCCYGTYDGVISGSVIPAGMMTSSQGYMGRWTGKKIQ